MNRSSALSFAMLTLLAGGSLLGGCVNQDAYDKLRETNAALTARNQELTEESNSLKKSITDLQNRLRSENLSVEERARLIAELEAKLAQQKNDYDALDKRLTEMKLGPLDAGTDAALAALAAANPTVMSYDPTRGLLRFNSDVTFASGSFELTAAARNAIGQLSNILKSGDAAQYDAYVVGHTDTQPVSRNRPKFSDNDELSMLRGLAVKKAMVADGIPAYKVLAGGFGQDRPAVENSASGNTAANRRVEIYLLKSTFGGLMARPVERRAVPRSSGTTSTRSSSTTPAPAPAPKPSVDEVIK
jgi:chemotaxis protein MotB